MASKYAYIVAADVRYTPELWAELNSLHHVTNEFDVHVIGYKLPQEMIEQFSKLCYHVELHDVTEEEVQESHGLSEVLCRKRYWYAAEIGKDYDAVCVLDADLVFVRNPKQYFDIAAKTGFILGPNKEQDKVYDDPHHQFWGEWIIPEGFYNDKDLCNCPLFIDAKLWGDALRDSWYWFTTFFPEKNMKCPDMDCMNVAFIKHGGYDKIIKLVGYQWLGTNEQLLKPYTRCVEKHGKLYTESGLEIWTYHGQFYHKKWRDCQLDNRHHCANGYLKATECSDNMAQGAMNNLHGYFKRMLEGPIVLEKKNYRHPEQEYIE